MSGTWGGPGREGVVQDHSGALRVQFTHAIGEFLHGEGPVTAGLPRVIHVGEGAQNLLIINDNFIQ